MEGSRRGGRRNLEATADDRQMPVVVIDRADLDVLVEVFEGRRLAVARSIYVGIVERVGSGDCEFTRSELASTAGVTKKTIDEYVPTLEACGLLVVERRREGTLNLPNLWRLTSAQPYIGGRRLGVCVYCGEPSDTLDHVVPTSKGGGQRGNVVPCCRSCNCSKQDRDVQGWAEASGRSWSEVAGRLAAWGVRSVPTDAGVPSFADGGQQSSSDQPPLGEKKTAGGGPATLPLPDGVEVSPEMLQDAASLLGRKTKVDGRLATPEEMAIVVCVLSEFNRQSGSDYGVGAHMRAIVMRIRERSSMDAAKHVRLVQSAWRLKWWERTSGKRRPTPAVIYGNERVFEQVVQDAVDEAKGVQRDESVEPPQARYSRED